MRLPLGNEQRDRQGGAGSPGRIHGPHASRSEAKPRVSKDDPEGAGVDVSWSVLRDAVARLLEA